MSGKRGGARQGAGRPAGDATKTVRVPAAGSLIARELVGILVRHAQDALKESYWYRTAPAHARQAPPEVELLEIAKRPFSCGLGESREVMVVVASAEVGDVRARFYVRLDGLGEWPAVPAEAHIEEQEQGAEACPERS